MTKILKALMPPLLYRSLHLLERHCLRPCLACFKRRKPKHTQHSASPLFDGNDRLFKETLAQTLIYGEYGCGNSTRWVLQNTNCSIYTVDTDAKWLAHALQNNNTTGRIRSKHSELGPVKDWGWPQDYTFRARFHQYTDWIWKHSKKPDTVLIDGRFRVCCFLTCLKYATAGTKIIFDDYINRPQYHVVEEFCPRAKTVGRQCLFIVPDQKEICTQTLEKEIKNFRCVME